jgi:hypothetical protein
MKQFQLVSTPKDFFAPVCAPIGGAAFAALDIDGQTEIKVTAHGHT